MHRSFVGLLCALFCLILTGCGGGGSQAQTSPQTRSELGQVFTIKIGQEALFEDEGLTVMLRGVTDDSRCPEDVACVWEGNARVQVELTKTPELGATVDLDTSPRIGPQEASYLNYKVKLVSLAPNTRSSRAIEPGEYVVGLLVSKQ